MGKNVGRTAAVGRRLIRRHIHRRLGLIHPDALFRGTTCLPFVNVRHVRIPTCLVACNARFTDGSVT